MSRFIGELYLPLKTYDKGWLDVGDGHHIFWEVSGNPQGKPAVFLHGGPGGACHADHRRLFNPAVYKIILFDQRGCGRSIPNAGLEANTTAHLIADLERLRLHLNVERWLILGGSWGATLALLYAQAFPQHVEALVLRGVFTGRQSELDWLYRYGASQIYPDAWQRFIDPIPEAERHDLISAYYQRLTESTMEQRIHFAKAWCAWEAELMSVTPRPERLTLDADQSLALARIETHYFVHQTFLAEGQILAATQAIAHIPCIIVQGRQDMVTPPATAWSLHSALPESQLHLVAGAAHATSEPGILSRLIDATDYFANL
jgi:proline iminopeptidase